MFTVYDTNKVATIKGTLWNGERFMFYDDAVEYAHNWLGAYSPGEDILFEMLKDGKCYTYYTGCTIHIAYEESVYYE